MKLKKFMEPFRAMSILRIEAYSAATHHLITKTVCK